MPLTEDNEHEYDHLEHPICPKCDEIINIEEAELFNLYEEDRHEIYCPQCTKKIIIESHCEKWEFSTSDPDNI